MFSQQLEPGKQTRYHRSAAGGPRTSGLGQVSKPPPCHGMWLCCSTYMRRGPQRSTWLSTDPKPAAKAQLALTPTQCHRQTRLHTYHKWARQVGKLLTAGRRGLRGASSTTSQRAATSSSRWDVLTHMRNFVQAVCQSKQSVTAQYEQCHLSHGHNTNTLVTSL